MNQQLKQRPVKRQKSTIGTRLLVQCPKCKKSYDESVMFCYKCGYLRDKRIKQSMITCIGYRGEE